MSYSGFATSKNLPVLGMDGYVSNIDEKPYQLLTYSSGLGYSQYNETIALHDFKNAFHKATIPGTWSNHGAEDVPLYAIGAMSNLLFSGTFDQTYVPHAIAYAMCIFEFKSRCHRNNAYIQRTKPTYEARKPWGIDALKLELNRQDQLEEKESLQANKKSFFQELITNNTLLDNYESSDLISNITSDDNTSKAISWKLSYLSISFFFVMFRINFI